MIPNLQGFPAFSCRYERRGGRLLTVDDEAGFLALFAEPSED
jgi:hypothetical protein